MLYSLLFPYAKSFPALNVFRYITFRTAMAAVTALLLALVLGLSGRGKLLPQILVALAIAWAIRQWAGHGTVSTVVTFPFLKRSLLDLGVLYLPFVAFVVVGSSNAVNLTDGLDGLAIGSVGI